MPPTENVVATMQAHNLRTWLETEAVKHGTDEQIDAYNRGILPDAELATIARTVLFADISTTLVRWSGSLRHKLRYRVRHTASCSFNKSHNLALIAFEAADAAELELHERENLRNIEAAVRKMSTHPWITRGDGSVAITTTAHWAECTECKGEERAIQCRVVVTWAGRELVREFQL